MARPKIDLSAHWLLNSKERRSILRTANQMLLVGRRFDSVASLKSHFQRKAAPSSPETMLEIVVLELLALVYEIVRQTTPKSSEASYEAGLLFIRRRRGGNYCFGKPQPRWRRRQARVFEAAVTDLRDDLPQVVIRVPQHPSI